MKYVDKTYLYFASILCLFIAFEVGVSFGRTCLAFGLASAIGLLQALESDE